MSCCLSLVLRLFCSVSLPLSASFFASCFINFFLFFGHVAFSEYFCTITVFYLYGECVVRFLDGLRAFGINADQWTTAAQDERGWRRTVEQGAEHFMAKWIVAEKNKAGLRHAMVCPNVTGRTRERIALSKRARAGSLALVD